MHHEVGHCIKTDLPVQTDFLASENWKNVANNHQFWNKLAPLFCGAQVCEGAESFGDGVCRGVVTGPF